MNNRTIVHCPHCGIDYEVDKSDLGKSTACEACGQSFTLGKSAAPLKPGKEPVPQILDHGKGRSPCLDDLRKVLAHTPVTVRLESAELSKIEISNIDVPLGRMISLIFKFAVAVFLVSAFFWLLFLALGALGITLFGLR